MILKKDQKQDIAQRLDFIRIQLEDLKRFHSLTMKGCAVALVDGE